MTIDTNLLRDLIHRASPTPWLLAASNSWRRIVDAKHAGVCTPCTQPDGHPDLQFAGGYEGASAQLQIEAVNSLPDLLDTIDGQTAEIARLRKALKDLMVASPSQLACEAFHHNPSDRHADADVCQPVKRYQDALEAASAALGQEQGESDE